MKQKTTKTCFIIGPTGESGTEDFERAVKIQKIVGRADGEYQVVHASQIAATGMIMEEITKHLVVDDVVIADLINSKPEVYYQMAIRHAVNKPIIYLLPPGENLPRGLSTLNSINGDLTDVYLAEEKLKKAFDAIQRSDYTCSTPFDHALIRDRFIQSASDREKIFADFFDALQVRISEQIVDLQRLTRLIEDSTRKPLHGIAEVFKQIQDVIEGAKMGGRIWFVGMTFGLGPPHRYRITKSLADSSQMHQRPGNAPDDLAAISITIEDQIQAKFPGHCTFNEMIQTLHQGLASLVEQSVDPVLVCLTHDKESLRKNFLAKLSMRTSYSSLAADLDAVADEIMSLHQAVASKVKGRRPISYVDSIPLQIVIVEKKGTPSSLASSKKACVVFHVGTGNIETHVLEDGETGFYTEVDSLVDMFETMAESLWEAGQAKSTQTTA